MNQDIMRQAFLTNICNQLDAINLSSEDLEENWIFYKTVHSSAATTLGHPSRKQAGLMRMMAKFRGFLEKSTDYTRHKKMILAQYPRKQHTATFICRTVQTKLRDMQNSWVRKKREEIQSFADRKDMKKFQDALKTIYDPRSSVATTLLSADGSTLLTDKKVKKVQEGKDRENTLSEKDSHFN